MSIRRRGTRKLKQAKRRLVRRLHSLQALAARYKALGNLEAFHWHCLKRQRHHQRVWVPKVQRIQKSTYYLSFCLFFFLFFTYKFLFFQFLESPFLRGISIECDWNFFISTATLLIKRNFPIKQLLYTQSVINVFIQAWNNSYLFFQNVILKAKIFYTDFILAINLIILIRFNNAIAQWKNFLRKSLARS